MRKKSRYLTATMPDGYVKTIGPTSDSFTHYWRIVALLENGKTEVFWGHTRSLAEARRKKAPAQEAAKVGRDVLIEPINTRDMPGFYLNRQDVAHQVLAHVGAPNLKVQMDLYHCQIVEGDLAMKLRHYLPTGRVGHIQIAGVPQRHEPDLGEINHAYLFALLDDLAYAGWVGCEYRPADKQPGGTSAGLGWFKPYLKR
jgi:hydroxypyruvate isomerase